MTQAPTPDVGLPERPTRVVATVQPLLLPFVPRFLANRQRDVATIRSAVERRDFEPLRTIGHNLKGVGGGYGFWPISTLGEKLEDAARRRDALCVAALADALAAYLDQVEIVPGGAPHAAGASENPLLVCPSAEAAPSSGRPVRVECRV